MKISSKVLSPILLTLLLSNSCYLFDEPEEFLNDRLCLYELELATDNYKLIKTFDYPSDGPYFNYYPNDNTKIIYGQYQEVHIINTSTNQEEIIKLDSLFITDNYVCLSPTANKIVFAAVSIIPNLSEGRGLFVLDIDTKEIKVLKDIVDKLFPDFYQYPQFSNNGQFIVYKHFNHESESSSDNGEAVHLSQIFMWDLSSNSEKMIYSSEPSSGINYAIFDHTDTNLIFVEKADKLQKIGISGQHVETIDDIHDFGYSSSIDEYPQYITSGSKIYYTCRPEDDIQENYQVFVYDMDSKVSGYLTDGQMPFSVNSLNGNILIKSRYNYTEMRSDVYVMSPTGTITKTIYGGVRGLFSPDGKKVLALVRVKADQ